MSQSPYGQLRPSRPATSAHDLERKTMMGDVCIYHIWLRGQLDEAEINARSPFPIVVIQVENTATQFEICTDQSGLLGLLRYLHTLGFAFLSITCDQ